MPRMIMIKIIMMVIITTRIAFACSFGEFGCSVRYFEEDRLRYLSRIPPK